MNRRTLLYAAGLVVLTAAVFGGVLSADFVQWDDNVSVYENPHIRSLDWPGVCWMFSDAAYALRYKPLTWLSYALIYQAGGLNPLGYHLANLLLHCLNTVLVFLVTRRLLAPRAPAPGAPATPARAGLAAAAGALLWAVNPLRVEPVARVTDLTFCLHLCLLLISLWCYLWRAASGSRPRGRLAYACSVAAYALAMLAYPFAFLYGLVLLVVDWCPLRRFEGCGRWWEDAGARQVLAEKIPFLLVGGIMLPTILARLNPAGIWAASQPGASLDLFERPMQAFYVWGYYAWKPWAPFHLSPVYTTLDNFNPHGWRFWFSAVLVVGTTALLLRRRRRWPGALALWAGHLVLLVPALGLTERPHFPADRYAYVPGVLWGVAAAAALWKAAGRPRLFAAGLACAAGLALVWAAASARQARVWHDSSSLFNHMLRELGDHPWSADVHWRLGSVLARQGKTAEAVRHYQASLRIQPTPNAYAHFARLMETNGNAEAALTNYLALLQLEPSPDAFARVGDLLAGLNRRGEAIALYRQTVKSFPDLAPALNNLAWLLATAPEPENRDGAEAIQLAARACALTRYEQPAFIGTLAAAYAEAGRFDEARDTAQKAIALAEAAGQKEVAERNRQLLQLYRAGKPFHEAGKPQMDTDRSRQSGATD